MQTCEIRWWGSKGKENPVLLYRDLKVHETAGDPQYRGRVSLIGEPEKGNVSLKLDKFTLSDRGKYVCYVESDQWYDEAQCSVNIKVVGSSPVLSLAEDGDKVKVTCASEGWSPQPTLTWRDKGGRELRNSADHYRTDSEGLVSVSSWLRSSSSNSEWISCSVGLSEHEIKEGRVLPFISVSTTGDSPGWKYLAISLMIVVIILIIAFIIFLKIRGLISQRDPTLPEGTPLIGE
ncbi:butyrophilin subfamily 1 member A1-like [Hoplias malabaricus]|uniref:butyrophilin subfamily 1 member A1-like n=1 Tax=Hoplias malabaricus TaxID=27720 RepID=UPI00346259BC